jgi:hypothetical protein
MTQSRETLRTGIAQSAPAIIAAAIAAIILPAAVLGAGASPQAVEIPLRQTILRLPNGLQRPIYSVPVRIGSTLIDTGVDTGSTGLRVLPNVLQPQDAQAGVQSEVYSYESGIKLDGVVGTAPIAFGSRAGSGFLQLVRTVGCTMKKPDCPATRVGGPEHYGLQGQGTPDAGFKAIAGLRFQPAKPGATDNPFVEIGVRRYLIDLPRRDETDGRIVLDPDARDTQDFVELPNAADVFGIGLATTVPGCLVNLSSNQAICGEILLDTGAPGISAHVPGATDTDWPLNTPARFIFGDGHGHALAIEDFTAGPVHFGHVHINGAPPQQAQAYISAGVTPYLAFSVLYDADRRGIALRPRAQAASAPVSRLP